MNESQLCISQLWLLTGAALKEGSAVINSISPDSVAPAPTTPYTGSDAGAPA